MDPMLAGFFALRSVLRWAPTGRRYPMLLRALGQTGLRVSALCLGGNVFGWTADEAASFAVLDAFVAGGGNFVDTADVYTRWVEGHQGGESEVVLGRWLHARKNRDKVILATKVNGPMGPEP